MKADRAEIDRARELRRAATLPERCLWRFLRSLRAEGHHFRRQAPFRSYVLDFVCYGDRLVIEVDGAHHGNEAQRAHDATRDAVLAREGFRTLRLLASDVLGNLEGVSVVIRESFAVPTPALPTRGRGKE